LNHKSWPREERIEEPRLVELLDQVDKLTGPFRPLVDIATSIKLLGSKKTS
jgi:hypothetical protein